jgi:hypothetical protein
MGRWRRWTRAVDLVLVLFGVYILSRMLFGPALLTLEAIEPASLREVLDEILPPMMRVALGIGLVATVGEAVKKIVRLVQGERQAAYPTPEEETPASG